MAVCIRDFGEKHSKFSRISRYLMAGNLFDNILSVQPGICRFCDEIKVWGNNILWSWIWI